MAITLVTLLNLYHFRIDLFSRLGAADCSILIKELMQVKELNFLVSAADLQKYTAPIRDLPGMAEFARDVEALNCSPCLIGGDLHKLTERINDPQSYWKNGCGMDRLTLWLHVGQIRHNNFACRRILDKAFQNLATSSSRVMRHPDYQRGLLLKRSSGHDYAVEIKPMGLSHVDGKLLSDPTSAIYQMGTFESITLNLFTNMNEDSYSRPTTFVMRLVGDRSITRVTAGTPTTSEGLLNIQKIDSLFFPFQWIPGTEINTTLILWCGETDYDYEENRRLCAIFSNHSKIDKQFEYFEGAKLTARISYNEDHLLEILVYRTRRIE